MDKHERARWLAVAIADLQALKLRVENRMDTDTASWLARNSVERALAGWHDDIEGKE